MAAVALGRCAGAAGRAAQADPGLVLDAVCGGKHGITARGRDPDGGGAPMLG